MAAGLFAFRMTPAHAIFVFGLICVAASKYVYIDDFKSTVFDTNSISVDHEVLNRTFLNINLTVHKVHNVKVVCGVHIKKFVNQKMKKVISWKNIDFCKFLNNLENNILYGVFSRVFTLSFLKSCPIKQGFYFIKQAYLDGNFLGLVLPPGTYFVRIDSSLVFDGIKNLVTTYMRITLT